MVFVDQLRPSTDVLTSDDVETSAGQEALRQRIENAIRVVNVVSSQVGKELQIKPMPPIDLLDTTPGIYVVDGSNRYSNGHSVVGAEFQFTKKNLSGAADSAHAAIPGDLYIERLDGSVDFTPVVAKCFVKRDADDRLVRIKRELTTMADMKQRGQMTIEPMAVAMAQVAGEQQMVLLTRRIDSLKTMDNLPWARGLRDPENVQSAIIGASALGRFVSQGWQHGDAKVKNVAQDEYGRFGMIDYETTTPIDPNNPFEIHGATNEDYGNYLKSLAKKGFFGAKGSSMPAVDVRDVIEPMSLAFTDAWTYSPQPLRDAAWEGTKVAIDTVLPGVRETNGLWSR